MPASETEMLRARLVEMGQRVDLLIEQNQRLKRRIRCLMSDGGSPSC
jgi:hypothetical protein